MLAVDDIVTLLRKYQPYNKLHGQAADEIERLTEWQKNALLALDKREAEIKRLQNLIKGDTAHETPMD